MDFAVRRTGKLNKISYNSLTNYFHTIQIASHAAGGFSHSGRSLMTLAVSDYVEVANALCELSTLDTLGNCDSFNINKKDETRRQLGASSRQAGNYSRLASQEIFNLDPMTKSAEKKSSKLSTLAFTR